MKSLILFQYDSKDVLELVRFMSIQLFVFFLLKFCFPLIISLSLGLTDAVSPFSFIILFILSNFCHFHLFKVCKKPNRLYGSLKCAVNHSKCILLWENLRNKSLCINLSLKERGKAVQEPEPNVALLFLIATALIHYKQICLKLIRWWRFCILM